MHTFKYKNWTITGSSIASDQTCLLIPELGVCFDMGFTFPECVKKGKIVLVSHGHADHIGSVHLHIRKRMRTNLPPATYVIPKVCMEPLSRLYPSVCALDEGVSDTQSKMEGVNILISEESPTLQVNRNMFIRSFAVIHKIPSRAYVIYEKRRKIKPEFNTMEWFGEKLAKYKKDNPTIAIDEEVDEPMIGFSGDTTIEGVLQNEDLLRCKLLLLECTYIGADITAQQSKERGHIHINDIYQHWERFNNDMVLLVHISPRYSPQDIGNVYANIPLPMRERLNIFDRY